MNFDVGGQSNLLENIFSNNQQLSDAQVIGVSRPRELGVSNPRPIGGQSSSSTRFRFENSGQTRYIGQSHGNAGSPIDAGISDPEVIDVSIPEQVGLSNVRQNSFQSSIDINNIDNGRYISQSFGNAQAPSNTGLSEPQVIAVSLPQQVGVSNIPQDNLRVRLNAAPETRFVGQSQGNIGTPTDTGLSDPQVIAVSLPQQVGLSNANQNSFRGSVRFNNAIEPRFVSQSQGQVRTPINVGLSDPQVIAVSLPQHLDNSDEVDDSAEIQQLQGIRFESVNLDTSSIPSQVNSVNQGLSNAQVVGVSLPRQIGISQPNQLGNSFRIDHSDEVDDLRLDNLAQSLFIQDDQDSDELSDSHVLAVSIPKQIGISQPRPLDIDFQPGVIRSSRSQTKKISTKTSSKAKNEVSGDNKRLKSLEKMLENTFGPEAPKEQPRQPPSSSLVKTADMSKVPLEKHTKTQTPVFPPFTRAKTTDKKVSVEKAVLK